MPSTDSSPTDAQLLERIRLRDTDAMVTLYDKYNRLIYTVGMRVLGDASAAEDLTHDVFLDVWKVPDRKISGTSMGPWLAVVARNRAIDILRKRKIFADTPEDGLPPEPSITPHAEDEQMGQRARAAVATLNDEQRQALEMAYFEGLTHSEIADKTGIPLGTIKTRIRAALQVLRKEFAC